MAPRGQVNYNNDSAIRRNVRLLCDDVAKKARNSRQKMWDAVHRARVAYEAANPGQAITGPPLPTLEELGRPSTGPSYMPRNPKGRPSVIVKKATAECNAA